MNKPLAQGEKYQSGRGITQDNSKAMTAKEKSGYDNVVTDPITGKTYKVHWDKAPSQEDIAYVLFVSCTNDAEYGDFIAQYAVGRDYNYGYGETQNFTEAMKWYKKSASALYAPAQYKVGYMYENGFGGVEKNLTEAVRWYRLAAAQGDVDAEKSLARLGQN